MCSVIELQVPLIAPNTPTLSAPPVSEFVTSR